MGQWFTYLRPKTTVQISFDELAEEIRSSNYVVALTGSGVSAASGIPTFRDPADGLWSRYDPTVYATIWGFWRHPSKIWGLIVEFLSENDPKPNLAHVALAELESLGFLNAIITQNVDNLHQDAGSQRVIQYHGNIMTASCYKCSSKIQLSRDLARDRAFRARLPPKCSCGGYYKPDVILFGEAIPFSAIHEANAVVDECDLLLVIGTSASVTPASNLPYRAMRHGAKVIEINLEHSGITNRISDKIVLGNCSGLMKVVSLLERPVEPTTRDI